LQFALCRAAVAAFKSVIAVNGTTLWLKFREAIGRDASRNTFRLRGFFRAGQFDGDLGGSVRRE
jgi:hypothetical protein